MNEHIIKRIVLQQLFFYTPISLHEYLNLDNSIIDKINGNTIIYIKKFFYIERLLMIPPIPFRLDYTKDYFDITPQEVINHVNCLEPKYTKRHIEDNLSLIHKERNKIDTFNNNYTGAYHMYALDKECMKHMDYLNHFKHPFEYPTGT